MYDGTGFDSAVHDRSVADKLWHMHWPLIVLVSCLSGIGVIELFSAAGGSFAPWAERQLVRFVCGLALMFCITIVPMRVWLGLAWPTYGAAVVLLAGVLWSGTAAMGARRWLQLGPLSLQPSEIAKIGVVLMLARYYQWLPARRISRPLWVLLPLLLIAMPVALTIKQPDLGSALLLLALGLTVMFLAGVSAFYFVGGGIATIVLAPLVWDRLHDYQRKRIATFLNPEQDLLGAGYHIQQSKIALGSGGLTGKGFMQSTQSAMNALPEKHTDFIFSIFGEEMGFVGTAAVVVLYAATLIVLIGMALRCHSQFGRLTIAGVAVTLFISVFVNIAMVIGVVPVVGVPLPFISYGGTSMISGLIGFGLAMCAFVNRTERIRPELMRAI